MLLLLLLAPGEEASTGWGSTVTAPPALWADVADTDSPWTVTPAPTGAPWLDTAAAAKPDFAGAVNASPAAWA